MSNIIKSAKYIMSDIKNNNNKFWYIYLHDNSTVITENGRVGNSPQVHTKSFGNNDIAESFYNKKIKEKETKGYTILNVVENTSVPNNNLLDSALTDINSDSDDTKELIKYLTKKNIHNITSSTNITYNPDTNTFTTPCGIVTNDGIDKAKSILDEMTIFINNSDFDNDDFISLLQDYIQLIPRKVDRKLSSSNVIPNNEALLNEYQILESLKMALLSVDTTVKETRERLFHVELSLVNDKKIIDHINKFYNSTKKSMHSSSSLKVKRIFSVKIDNMNNAFNHKGLPIGNVMELWHGTRVENVLSILKSGLIIPKSSAGHVTGRMFGDGLYFSDQSTKSLNYSQGYWSKSKGYDNNCFMFLADVAMGKTFTPNNPSSNLPKKGYDSTFAKAGISGVMNNEMIVYQLYQCNLKYLVEFSE